VDRLSDAVHPADFLVLFVAGWASIPIVGVLYYGLTTPGSKPFDESWAYLVAVHLSQLAKIAIAIYIIDCLVVALHVLGFSVHNLDRCSRGLAKILYILWVAHRLSVLKRYLISRAVAKAPTKLGRASIFDRLIDGVICVVAGLFLCDILEVEMGMAVSSMFAFGSAGTIIFGLASKDVAAMFVSGLALSMSDRMNEGDEVKFGDGTCGFIHKFGWMQTTIRGYNNLLQVVRTRVCPLRDVVGFDTDG